MKTQTKFAIRNPQPATRNRPPCWPLLLAGLAPAALAANTNLTFKAEISFRETFDSNVYLQDAEPDYSLVPQAAEPFKESFVTAVTPKLSLDYRPGPAFTAAVSYAPEVAFYHAASSEDYVAHRGQVNLSGKAGALPWQFANALTYVQGSDQGLYFGAPGGPPAIGGIPIRDRREQFVYRGRLNTTWTRDSWFLRPVATAYWHDFRTEQKDISCPENRGYENYVDRREANLGLDVGRQVGAKTKVFAGYRFGWEVQGHLVGSPYHYDAEYHRPVVGIEGQPAKWITANLSLGPDIHHTTGPHPPTFETDYTTLWVDGVVTLLPTKQDSCVLTWRANTQPAFASCSVYDDITYDFVFKHTFNSKWSALTGYRLYIGDWFAPVTRDDWINTVSAGVAYKHNQHLSAELAYAYDWVDSKVPNTAGREFTRHLGSLSLRYAF